MALLLKNGRVLDPSVGLDAVCDVIIRDGRIVEIGEDLSIPKGITVECAEKIVVPGLVDVHTHLREPGYEYKEDVESGTRAAAHGGFTAVCAMPNTNPVCDEGAAVRFLVERAAERGKVRVYPIGALTVGLKGEALAEMGDMLAEGAVAFSDDGKGVQDAGTMRRAMDYARAFGTTVVAHCEDEALVGKGVVNEGAVSTRLGMAGWPSAGEEIAVARDIALAELTGCRLHLAHVSTAGALEQVRAAKERGVAVTCEVTPHHLFLTEDDLTPEYDTNFKMNPPLRTEADRLALVAGLVGRHGGLHRHRPRAARAAREGAGVRAGAIRDDRARDCASAGHHQPGSSGPHRLGGPRPSRWPTARAPRSACRRSPLRPGRSPTSRSSIRRPALR